MWPSSVFLAALKIRGGTERRTFTFRLYAGSPSTSEMSWAFRTEGDVTASRIFCAVSPVRGPGGGRWSPSAQMPRPSAHDYRPWIKLLAHFAATKPTQVHRELLDGATGPFQQLNRFSHDAGLGVLEAEDQNP